MSLSRSAVLAAALALILFCFLIASGNAAESHGRTHIFASSEDLARIQTAPNLPAMVEAHASLIANADKWSEDHTLAGGRAALQDPSGLARLGELQAAGAIARPAVSMPAWHEQLKIPLGEAFINPRKQKNILTEPGSGIRYNGIVIHENEELTGPTRSAACKDEQAQGPLMLQGDHRPVVYRNLRIKHLDRSTK